jgi:hypothetical protein
MSDFVQQQANKCSFETSDSWVILSPIEQSIKHKIESVGTPLKDWDIQINYGIKTGFNDAFVIKKDTREQILNNCQNEDERKRTDELIRPILRGRDIKRYGYEWKDLWLINTHNGVKGKFPRIDINDYPAVKAHLDQYWDKIEKRADQGDTPYNLRNCAYVEDFSKPKIVWIELSDEAKFTLSENEIPLNTIFLMTGDLIKHIIGYLNSSIILWYFTNCLGCSSGVGTTRWLKFTIERLPIPHPDRTGIDLSSLTVKCPDEVIEKEIDELVAQSYGLTKEEITYLSML